MTVTVTHKRLPLFLLQAALLFQLLASTLVLAADNASTSVESIFDSVNGIKVGGTILAVAAIAAGVVICVSGYKLFRPTLFVIGFALGGVLIAVAAEEIFKNKSWVVTASWIAFVVGGLIIGFLVISLYKLSIFIAGAVGGVLLAMLINTSFGYKMYPSHPNIVLIILAVVLGIIGGVLAIMLEKPVIVVATSLVGECMVVWGIGYFAGDFPSASDLKSLATQNANGDWNYDIPNAWWAYLASILVLFVIGMVAQFRKTGRGVNHHHRLNTHAVPSREAEQQQEFTAVSTPQQKDNAPNHYGNPVSHV